MRGGGGTGCSAGRRPRRLHGAGEVDCGPEADAERAAADFLRFEAFDEMLGRGQRRALHQRRAVEELVRAVQEPGDLCVVELQGLEQFCSVGRERQVADKDHVRLFVKLALLPFLAARDLSGARTRRKLEALRHRRQRRRGGPGDAGAAESAFQLQTKRLLLKGLGRVLVSAGLADDDGHAAVSGGALVLASVLVLVHSASRALPERLGVLGVVGPLLEASVEQVIGPFPVAALRERADVSLDAAAHHEDLLDARRRLLGRSGVDSGLLLHGV
mmetsp:Transcript_11615/g.38827  ORF Transcript_11615/g.38827 Transcript_11615/m.38827 type:complete len:273 (+) Transcript_11615:105-923(+)